ncbi:SIMPL domain-containing protein [Tabrizicola sp.]|uniref:SIMPL domain-containing protein n=1 Tax=Tabrizicola sp. TaxID=2005166 RepID=UPI00261D1E3F|nr:SIMPL domain-containing protein [Tabrizicola sp.]MDM7933454.1 SIMPL domain-containing protein [Tabrizicola sp.]
MRVLSAVLLSAALALPLPAMAEDAMPPMITVTGTGAVEAAPDIATLTIGVTTQGDTAADALGANTVALEAVMARLTSAGIEPRDIQTSNLSLNPNWTGYENNKPTISGYVANNMLTIRVRQLDGLGTVLDAAVADGANTLNGLSFGLADPDPVLNEARREAVADARARAELLASAAGVKLGRIISISEAGFASDPVPMFRAEVAAAPVPVAAGELGMSANVTIFYEIVE